MTIPFSFNLRQSTRRAGAINGVGGDGAPGPLQRHIPALDGVRGIAILLVMAHHFTNHVGAEQCSGVGREIFALLRMGWCGVDLFFVLSGFLITGILLDTKGSPGYLRNFYVRRILRIFPLYYGVLLVLALAAPLLAPLDPTRIGQFIRDEPWLWCYGSNILTAWRNDFVYFTDWFRLSHFWSLAVEEHFYLFWPVIVLVCSRRALVWFCVSCIAVAFALRCPLVVEGYGLGAYVLSPCRMDALALGGLLAVVARQVGDLDRLGRWARVLMPLGIVFLVALAWWRQGLHPQDPAVQTGGYTLLALAAGCFLMLALTAPMTNGLGQLLNHPVLRFFGKYSYGMYVFHGLLYPVFAKVFPADGLAILVDSRFLAIVLHVAASTLATVLIALANWHLCEKHFLKLKRFFAHQAPRPAVEPASTGRRFGADLQAPAVGLK